MVDGKVNHKMYGLTTRFLRLLFALYVDGLKRLIVGNFVEIAVQMKKPRREPGPKRRSCLPEYLQTNLNVP